MIDLHCHALPGIDDGPEGMDEALDLARSQVAAGVRTVVATPHVGYHYPDNDAGRIAAVLGELRAALAAAEIALEVLPGAEVALTRALELDDGELTALRLGGGPWLLAEAPMSPAASAGVEGALRRLADRGHQLLLAHPERCPVFVRDRPLLERLVAGGMRCSITATSLTGRFGRDPQRFALALLRDGLVHDVSSDAHGPTLRRPAGLAGPLEEAGWGTHVAWLCDVAPRSILEGSLLPPPPPLPTAPQGLVARLLRRA